MANAWLITGRQIDDVRRSNRPQVAHPEYLPASEVWRAEVGGQAAGKEGS